MKSPNEQHDSYYTFVAAIVIVLLGCFLLCLFGCKKKHDTFRVKYHFYTKHDNTWISIPEGGIPKSYIMYQNVYDEDVMLQESDLQFYVTMFSREPQQDDSLYCSATIYKDGKELFIEDFTKIWNKQPGFYLKDAK